MLTIWSTDGVWNLATYNITFEWISGAKNKAADCLSRLVKPISTSTSINMLTASSSDEPAFHTRSHTQHTSNATSTPHPDTSPQISQKPTTTHKNHSQWTIWMHYCKCREQTHSVNAFPRDY